MELNSRSSITESKGTFQHTQWLSVVFTSPASIFPSAGKSPLIFL